MIMNKRDAIRAALISLTPREERVIRMRFGIGGIGTHSLEEIGQTFCVSMERIRQIQSKALRKLKASSRSVTLRDFV
jgi:RNA polymerase primary sigma factor